MSVKIGRIAGWAEKNLLLNASKVKKWLFEGHNSVKLPFLNLLTGIAPVDSMNILGVVLRCDLSFHEQVDRLVTAQTLYALRLIRSQGLNGPNLWEVAEATLVSRLSHASQASIILCITGLNYLLHHRPVWTWSANVNGCSWMMCWNMDFSHFNITLSRRYATVQIVNFSRPCCTTLTYLPILFTTRYVNNCTPFLLMNIH